MPFLSREHSKKFSAEEMQAQLDGKICMVTGANSGIGFATAEGLAARYCFLFCFLVLHWCNLDLRLSFGKCIFHKCLLFKISAVQLFIWFAVVRKGEKLPSQIFKQQRATKMCIWRYDLLIQSYCPFVFKFVRSHFNYLWTHLLHILEFPWDLGWIWMNHVYSCCDHWLFWLNGWFFVLLCSWST